MKLGDRIGGVFTEDELAEAWAEETGQTLDRRLCAWFRIVAMYSEFCTMVRALLRQADGHGRMTGSRTLPLVARLHLELIIGIQEYDHGRIHL